MLHPVVFEARNSLPPFFLPMATPPTNGYVFISHHASFSPDTCTVDLAGGAGVKYLAYTSFMQPKSFMSFRN